MSKIRTIYNPSKLTQEEKDFVSNNNSLLKRKKTSYKGRMISMSDDFYQELNSYLKNNPTEGNRSSFIVRIVAEYIKNNQ
jgi:hypothetical protein